MSVACDDCCGHGNEDGECHLFEDPDIKLVASMVRARSGSVGNDVEVVLKAAEVSCSCAGRDPSLGWCLSCHARFALGWPMGVSDADVG